MGETVLFGRYRLLEPAGSGGSAQVWRAIDLVSGDEVAVKRLHPIVFADVAGRARLRREFGALRALDEPHVVRVRDLRIDGSEAALILDFVAGPSLAERLAAGPPFVPAEAVTVAFDIAAALTAAHAAGIVHRDVTPANILLDPADGARLTDFGIALGGDEPAVTATGQVMGTLRYLAPEQLRGAAATPASDLHGLAAVTYEMLAGRPAYAAATPVALAEEHARGPEPIAGVPPALDALVRRGMALDPADRPRDVATFAAELERAFERGATESIAIVPGGVTPLPGG
jgi:serine/threonine protein kinase